MIEPESKTTRQIGHHQTNALLFRCVKFRASVRPCVFSMSVRVFLNVRPPVSTVNKRTRNQHKLEMIKNKNGETGDSLFSYGDLYNAVFDESSTDRQGSVSTFDRCHSREKRRGIENLKNSVLFGSGLVCKKDSVPDCELRKSNCDENYAQKRHGSNVFCNRPTRRCFQ